MKPGFVALPLNNAGMKMRIEGRYPPATPQALAAFEAEIGATFPESYRAFLLEHNGGTPHPETVFISEAEGETDLRMLYGLHGSDYGDLRKEREIFRDRMPSELLPIGEDSCGNQFCIALSGPNRSAIYFWDHEREADYGEMPSYDNLTQIADSFEALLDNLYEFDDSQLDEAKVISVWVDPDFKPEFTKPRKENEDEPGTP